MINKEILDIICCPRDKAALRYDAKKNILTCAKCKTVYHVENDVPLLLVK